MRRFAPAWALLVAVPMLPAAAAEPPKLRTKVDERVDDPAKKLTPEAVTGAVTTRDGTSLDACWTQPGALTARLVVEKGKVAAIELMAGPAGLGEPP